MGKQFWFIAAGVVLVSIVLGIVITEELDYSRKEFIRKYEKPDTSITIRNGKPDTIITKKNAPSWLK